MKLLIVSTRVEDYNVFVEAVNESTEVITVNSEADTYASILEKKKSDSYESVGIVDYNYNTTSYSLVENEADIFSEAGFDSFIDFIKSLNTPIIDFMACSLFSDENWRSLFDKIETMGINCRSSNDLTGNLSSGGDWILESEDTPVNVANIYFTSLLQNYSKLLDNTTFISFWGDKINIVETDDYIIYSYGYLDNNNTFNGSFALFYKKFKKIWITGYGSSNIATYGYWLADSNGNIFDNIDIISGSGRNLVFKSGQFTYIFNPTTQVYPNIITVGLNGPPLLNVSKISGNSFAFAIINSDGVYAIGDSGAGGIDSRFATQVRLQNATTGPFLTDVRDIYSTTTAFAVKGASGVYAWGFPTNGGINSSFATQVRLQNGTTGPFLTDVQEVYSAVNAFAVKGVSGVYAWGSAASGGINNSFATQLRLENGTTGPFLTDVQDIYSNSFAFAVKGASGVYAWGFPTFGGINSSFATQLRLENGTTGPFLTDIQDIYSAANAFAVKGASGVYAWGSTTDGGINNSFATQLRLENGTTGPFLTDIQDISVNAGAFIAKGNTGVYVWGGSGNPWPASFAREVREGGTGPLLTNIDFIGQATSNGFLVKSNNTYYRVPNNSLTPIGFTGYTEAIGSVNQTLFYNNQNVINSFFNVVDGIAKTKNATNVQQVALSSISTAFKTPTGIFARGSRDTGGFSYYNITASKLRVGNQFTGPFLESGDIYSTTGAFAVKGASGVYAWGNSTFGGINQTFATQLRLENGTTGPFLTDVQDIYSANTVFAVKGTSGVYAWGSTNNGGINEPFATQVRLQNATTGPFLTDVQDIYSTDTAFAVKGASGVYAWGSNFAGGINSNFATQLRLENGTTGPFLTDVQDIYSADFAFAVKGASGVYAWGNSTFGGINTNFATQLRLENGTTGPFLTDVQDIYSAGNAFAVKGVSGVYAWGSATNGGINSNFATQVRLQNGITGPFLTDAQDIYSTVNAFAVKGASGVYAWGSIFDGGITNSFATQVRLENGTTGPFLTDVQDIYSTDGAFAVKGASGVYTWGNTTFGGITNSFATQVRLQNGTTGPFLTDVQDIYSADFAFAVKGASGVYAWGNNGGGGINPSFATQVRINDASTGPFLTDVEEIYARNTYFIAKTSSSLYYGWGGSVGMFSDYAIQIPIADYEEIIAPDQIENTNIQLDSSKTTVQQLLSQANSDASGIAITRATNWRYKPSSSSSWKTIEDVSDENGLLLTLDAELEYDPSAKSEPTLDFKAWNGEVGDEEDYLNTNIEYFNLVSTNTASVTAKVEPAPSDNSTLRIIIIAIIVAIAIVLLYFIIYYAYRYFNTNSSRSKIYKSI